MAHGDRNGMGRAGPLCPVASDVDLLRYGERIIDLDPEIANGAFYFRVSEQKLDRAQIPGSPIDQGRLGSAQRMRPIKARIQAGICDP